MATIKSLTSINGFVDPRKTFWENVRLMSESANAWTTFDNSTGKWSVVINEVTASSKSFTLDNILSELKISQVNISDQYNVAEISFPNRDVAGKMDTIRIEQFNRSALEPENILNITNEFINDSITAKAIGQTLLNQSRNDKIVEFTSDYSVIGLTPGDVIDITLDTLGWNAKKFRVISIEEVDGDDGELFYNILCIEYYDSDYGYSNFNRVTTIESANVPPIKSNTDVEQSKADKASQDVTTAAANDPSAFAAASAAANQSDSSYFLALLSSLNVPYVGGGTGAYSAGSLETYSKYVVYFSAGSAVQNVSFSVSWPFSTSLGTYLPGTLDIHRNPTFDAFGNIISTSSRWDTFYNDGTNDTTYIQYYNLPAGNYYFQYTWDSTPGSGTLDADRYTYASTSGQYAMKMGFIFLYT